MAADSDGPVNYTVVMHDTPRVFISYRWGKHDEWVNRFAMDLVGRGVEVIHDRSLRQVYPTEATIDFLSRLLNSMHECHAFLPIFTPDYLERIGYRNGQKLNRIDDGVVFDEFQKSLLLGRRKALETIAIVLDGDYAYLPKPFTEKNTIDMRNPDNYEKRLGFLSQYLHLNRAVKQRKASVVRGVLPRGDA